jgi:hypothetical protein
MRNITRIAKYGKNSFTKAERTKPRAYRRTGLAFLSFTIKSERADGPRYIVRIASESRRILGECVNAATNKPCEGFLYYGHCYHLSRALILMDRMSKKITEA